MMCCYRRESCTKQLLFILCTSASLLCFMLSMSEHQTVQRKNTNFLTPKTSQSSVFTSSENPSNYLLSERFDVIVKMVYAYFQVHERHVPKVVFDAYTEHLRVWNNFKEYCRNIKKSWFDSTLHCSNKTDQSDFISSFKNTISTIKTEGFNSNASRIPVDKNGFLLNGAHRVAAATILSRNASFEHHDYQQRFDWGYKFFKKQGLTEMTMNFVMLEWMKIQRKLPFLNTSVSIISIFSNDHSKDVTMRKMVKEQCSKDNGILYEREINFTKSGIRQLITHMYGGQSWLETKIKQLLSKFNLTYRVLFLFVYGKSNLQLTQCKNEVRKFYNDKIFKSTIHIPDTKEENQILAEMILNPNSVQFMNYAKNAPDCKFIAKEIASRSSIEPIETLPGVYLVRDDIMVDSGTVLGLFGLRKRTDVDLLFLHKIDTSILGNRNGFAIQAHAFKYNSISKERPWGEDHFSANGTKDQLDLFYDPKNYGYCYGIKFVSLKQLVRYKTKRNEPKKDVRDVELINKFLETNEYEYT